MDAEELQFLLEGGGLEAAREVERWPLSDADRLADLVRLRERHGQLGARAIVELVTLRRRARGKFRRADEMLFDREALEQATSEPVARHRARRFRSLGVSSVSDLGCGIGGDALALADGLSVVAVDRDPVRLRMARFNVLVYEPDAEVRCERRDLERWDALETDALFFDPARRGGGRRARGAGEYSPPLARLQHWLPSVEIAAAKVAPGIRPSDLPPQAEVEWISLAGELKEAALWLGAGREPGRRRAVVLPSGETLEQGEDRPAPVSDVGPHLLDPDPAVIQARLVDELALRIGGSRLDPGLPHLTTAEPVETSLARCYRVQEVVERPLRTLRRRLKERGIGRITLASRGVTLDLEKLRRQLRVRADEAAHVIFTRRLGEVIAVICAVP